PPSARRLLPLHLQRQQQHHQQQHQPQQQQAPPPLVPTTAQPKLLQARPKRMPVARPPTSPTAARFAPPASPRAGASSASSRNNSSSHAQPGGMAGAQAEAPPQNNVYFAHRWAALASLSAPRERSQTPPKSTSNNNNNTSLSAPRGRSRTPPKSSSCRSEAFRIASEKVKNNNNDNDSNNNTISRGDCRQRACMLEAGDVVSCLLDVTVEAWAVGLLAFARQAVNGAAAEPVPSDEWPKLCQQLPPSPFARPGGAVQLWQCEVSLHCGRRLRGLSLARNQQTAQRACALAALVAGEASGLLRDALWGPAGSDLKIFAKLVAEVRNFVPPTATTAPAAATATTAATTATPPTPPTASDAGSQSDVAELLRLLRASLEPNAKGPAAKIHGAMIADLARKAPNPARSQHEREKTRHLEKMIEVRQLRYAHDSIAAKFLHGEHAGQPVEMIRANTVCGGCGVFCRNLPPLVVVRQRGLNTVVDGHRRLKGLTLFQAHRGGEVFANCVHYDLDGEGCNVPAEILAKLLQAQTSDTAGLDVDVRRK
ncbi:unnamed protein product, partial [Polarella glacialis]